MKVFKRTAELYLWVVLGTYVIVDVTYHYRGQPWTRSNPVCTTVEAVP